MSADGYGAVLTQAHLARARAVERELHVFLNTMQWF
jgi:hypothetical protein